MCNAWISYLCFALRPGHHRSRQGSVKSPGASTDLQQDKNQHESKFKETFYMLFDLFAAFQNNIKKAQSINFEVKLAAAHALYHQWKSVTTARRAFIIK